MNKDQVFGAIVVVVSVVEIVVSGWLLYVRGNSVVSNEPAQFTGKV